MAEDIISTLPDAILCHILSFLETTYTVATSILSKRWKHLWHSVPTLYFNTLVTVQNFNYDFNDFVYSVLVTRDATLPIKSFHLHVTYFKVLNEYFHHPVNVITKWVNFVVQRKVEYLNLHVEYLDSAGLAKIPTSILTCTTLVVLKLFCFSVEEGYSSSVVLPSLKTLHLESMIFTKLPDLMMFLNGCPNLEDLLTFDVVFDSEESLTCEDWKSFCLSSLTRADIDCTYSYFPLKAVHNVPSLRFEINQADTEKKTWTRKDEKENWVDPDVVPQCLSLHLRTCDLFNFLGLQGELLLAEYILKNAKVLQIMRIRNVGQTKIKRLISSCPKASTT